MGAEVSDNVHGVNGVQALRPAESGSHRSINSEFLQGSNSCSNILSQ